MYLFTKGAEDKLLRALEGTPHEKMALFAASTLHNAQRNALRTPEAIKHLRKAAREFDVRIFMMPDGDVAFLFTDAVNRFWPKFETTFSRALPGFDPDQIVLSSLMKIYDLTVELAEARQVITAKKRLPALEEPLLISTNSRKSALQKNAIDQWDADIFAAVKANRKTRTKPLIGVADDDEFILSLVRSVLRPTYEVVTTQDARTILRMYNLHAPDILLLDIMMPHLDGLKVLQEIHFVDRDAIILMLSAHSTEQKIFEAQEYGACGFLTKPFKPESLLHYISSTLKQRRTA